MMTLKDIKISKVRIPLQNAIWLRPVGGLSFKIYYPHGGDWAEINVDSSVTPTPKPSPSPTPTPSYITSNSWEPMIVVAGRCVPMNARIGTRYFFADGRIKFKVHTTYETEIWTYGYSEKGKLEFKAYPVVPLLRKENFNPILITIISEDTYKENKYGNCKKFEVGSGTQKSIVYYRTVAAEHLTCETSSPYFKVIDGHLRNVKTPRMPVVQGNSFMAAMEAKHFVVRRPKRQKIRETGVFRFHYGKPRRLASFENAWRLEHSFSSYLNQQWYKDSSNVDNWKRTRKTFKIREINRNRKTKSLIIERTSEHITGGKYGGTIFKPVE